LGQRVESQGPGLVQVGPDHAPVLLLGIGIVRVGRREKAPEDRVFRSGGDGSAQLHRQGAQDLAVLGPERDRVPTRTAPPEGRSAPCRAQVSCSIVAHSPGSRDPKTSSSDLSRGPLATTALPFVWTSIMSL